MAGRLLQSLPVVIMRPKDLIAYSRHAYSQPNLVRMYGEPSCVDSGLSLQEKELASHLPPPPGRLLLIGSGGGRDAIGLARLGFAVTALDFSIDQLRTAEKNATRHGVTIHTLMQDMTNLNLGPASFKVVWMSPYLYSTVPTPRRRQAIAERIAEALEPGGVFVCQFRYRPHERQRKRATWLKSAAWLTLGNVWYIEGDTLLGDREFIHAFASESVVLSEVVPAGFKAFQKLLNPEQSSGAVLFRKHRKEISKP